MRICKSPFALVIVASGVLAVSRAAHAPMGHGCGDLNGDGVVSLSDEFVLLAAWGDPGGPADIDGDGDVGPFDLAILLCCFDP